MTIRVPSLFDHRGDFGNGFDGDVTLAVNTTLTRDMDYLNLIVPVGIALDPAGFRIFVQETLTNNGIISRAGNNTSTFVGSPALISRVLMGGQKGGDGGFTDGVEGDPSTAYPATPTTGRGGSGGNGALINGVGQGAAAGVVLYVGARPLEPEMARLMISGNVSLVVTMLTAGSGGGGGGGPSAKGGDRGGGGGGGGGNGVLAAQTLINSGTIDASGGDGADGQGGAGGGGGGGGGGGIWTLIYHTRSGALPDVSGGAGGLKGAGGNAQDGIAGSDGIVFEVVIEP